MTEIIQKKKKVEFEKSTDQEGVVSSSSEIPILQTSKSNNNNAATVPAFVRRLSPRNHKTQELDSQVIQIALQEDVKSIKKKEKKKSREMSEKCATVLPAAIEQFGEPQGVTTQQLIKFVSANSLVPEGVSSRQITEVLKKLVKKGILENVTKVRWALGPKFVSKKTHTPSSSSSVDQTDSPSVWNETEREGFFKLYGLPIDMFLEILSWLEPIPDVINLFSVSKTFQRLARHPRLWRRIDLTHYPDIPAPSLQKLIRNSGAQLKELVVRCCQQFSVQELELVAQVAPDLEVLDFSYCTHSIVVNLDSSLVFPKLESLGAVLIDLDKRWFELKPPCWAPNLKKLVVGKIAKSAGWESFHRLEEFSCQNYNWSPFGDVILQYPLKVLSFETSTQNANALFEKVSKLQTLEILQIKGATSKVSWPSIQAVFDSNLGLEECYFALQITGAVQISHPTLKILDMSQAKVEALVSVVLPLIEVFRISKTELGHSDMPHLREFSGHKLTSELCDLSQLTSVNVSQLDDVFLPNVRDLQISFFCGKGSDPFQLSHFAPKCENLTIPESRSSSFLIESPHLINLNIKLAHTPQMVIGALPSLQTAKCCQNLTFAPSASLPQLSSFVSSCHNFKQLDELAVVAPNLKILEIESLEVSSSNPSSKWDPQNAFKCLERLTICNFFPKTKLLAKAAKMCPALQILQLRGSGKTISLQKLAQCMPKSLVALDCWGCYVDFQKEATFPAVQELVIGTSVQRTNTLTDLDCMRLCQIFPQLQIVEVRNSKVTNRGLRIVAGSCKTLKLIISVGNKITDIEARQLQDDFGIQVIKKTQEVLDYAGNPASHQLYPTWWYPTF